ncbi:Uncharacterised protein [Mycobacterium tuberculosis]|nr:Uncharacterised protein [Mycobacterium tuberculosis]COY49836.1 Uncharacterised protein [Mycobacterium tuberculosis]
MSPISSGRVNAEWAGPRRAATTTSRTAELRNADNAWSAMSVAASSCGSAASTRATSSATFPLPMITTRS